MATVETALRQFVFSLCTQTANKHGSPASFSYVSFDRQLMELPQCAFVGTRYVDSIHVSSLHRKESNADS